MNPHVVPGGGESPIPKQKSTFFLGIQARKLWDSYKYGTKYNRIHRIPRETSDDDDEQSLPGVVVL
jgi:hypothetical protein